MPKKIELTRTQLIGLNINFVKIGNNVYFVRNKKDGTLKFLKPFKVGDRYYICFRVNKVKYKFSAARVAYAFYNVRCPDDMEVEFVNGNPLDLSEKNLILISHKDLIYKRIWSKFETIN